ncbi:argonaute 3 [Aphelenchoides avenae]|nr:argonaute 3 [Aphelenchus avenae]
MDIREKVDAEVTKLYRVYVEYANGDKVFIDETADFGHAIADAPFAAPVEVKSWKILHTADAEAENVKKFAEKFRATAERKAMKVPDADIEQVEQGEISSLDLGSGQFSYLVFISDDDRAVAQGKLLGHKHGVPTQTLAAADIAEAVSESGEAVMLMEVSKMLVKTGGVSYVPRLDGIRDDLRLENTLVLAYTVERPYDEVTFGYSANVLAHPYAFSNRFFFVEKIGQQGEQLMTNLLRQLSENRGGKQMPEHVLIIRKGIGRDLRGMINDNLPAFHRAIKAFSEEYRPKVSALFLHRKMDGRIRDNVKLYDSITSGDGIEFATKSATNRDGLREFSVMGNFLEKGKPPIPSFYAVAEDGIGLSSLESMSLMRLLCHCHQNMPRAIRVPDPVRKAEKMVELAQTLVTELEASGIVERGDQQTDLAKELNQLLNLS